MRRALENARIGESLAMSVSVSLRFNRDGYASDFSADSRTDFARYVGHQLRSAALESLYLGQLASDEPSPSPRWLTLTTR